MLQRLSKRNNTNCIIFGLSEHDNNDSLSQKSNADKTSFAIGASLICTYQHRQSKNLVRVGKIEPVLPNIFLVLSRVPFKLHRKLLPSPRSLTFNHALAPAPDRSAPRVRPDKAPPGSKPPARTESRP